MLVAWPRHCWALYSSTQLVSLRSVVDLTLSGSAMTMSSSNMHVHVLPVQHVLLQKCSFSACGCPARNKLFWNPSSICMLSSLQMPCQEQSFLALTVIYTVTSMYNVYTVVYAVSSMVHSLPPCLMSQQTNAAGCLIWAFRGLKVAGLDNADLCGGQDQCRYLRFESISDRAHRAAANFHREGNFPTHSQG